MSILEISVCVLGWTFYFLMMDPAVFHRIFQHFNIFVAISYLEHFKWLFLRSVDWFIFSSFSQKDPNKWCFYIQRENLTSGLTSSTEMCLIKCHFYVVCDSFVICINLELPKHRGSNTYENSIFWFSIKYWQKNIYCKKMCLCFIIQKMKLTFEWTFASHRIIVIPAVWDFSVFCIEYYRRHN